MSNKLVINCLTYLPTFHYFLASITRGFADWCQPCFQFFVFFLSYQYPAHTANPSCEYRSFPIPLIAHPKLSLLTTTALSEWCIYYVKSVHTISTMYSLFTTPVAIISDPILPCLMFYSVAKSIAQDLLYRLKFHKYGMM